MSEAVEILRGYHPGAVGAITELHARYYSEHWNFGVYFETKVATEICEFLNRYDADKDGLWLARCGSRLVGSVVIDALHAGTEGSHLRWFILHPDFAGQGIGKTLLQTAIAHCEANRLSSAYLWTFQGLDAARHLYESCGFQLTEEHVGEQWGTAVTEQRFERRF